MKSIKTFISENKEIVLGGIAVVGIIVIGIIGNKSEFIQGCRELIKANEEGRLERDF